MMMLIRTAFAALAALVILAAPQQARAQSSFEGVERIVAIGDLEGAYEKYLDMLRTAGLIDADGDWIGGRAHLVQLGDIPDRGPHSRAIIDHLRRISPQARRAGGRVHALIGNHEAMNVEGDLRYVHPGEYAAFATAASPRAREQYMQRAIRHIRANPPPEGVPAFDEAWRAQWESEHPLGWVEHRRAWAPTGEYGRWISSNNAVVRINDTLFLHGGLGPSYVRPDIALLNRAVTGALRLRPVPGYEGIVEDQEGPLWYRGLARNDEPGETVHLEALLSRHGVARIVIGHTKLAPMIVPRFGGRVLVADIAVPRGYSDPHAFLLIEGAQAFAVHRGQRVPIQAGASEARCAYMGAIAALDPEGAPTHSLAEACAAPALSTAE
ncbi:MAG TPA: metallophosphoesterase [Terricaulis sp.]|nr:metallophosphoesterase [Terricaulis sp.]